MRLTPQQQAVVNHNYGPAFVFAVAGAGKTTALEQRIARLVRERVFAPQRILAAAYNTAVKEELGDRLRGHAGCAEVEVMTLHALGLRAVRLAWEAGLLPDISRDAFKETEHAQETLLVAALAEARRRKVAYVRELDSLDRTDFFTWLSGCKGNLLYPNVSELPAALRKTGQVQQAAAPPLTPWYLPFSHLMATLQQARGLITFDDQLRVGWELLVAYPKILTQLQKSFDCVLVDEFQDVNRAQYLILDMLTAPRPDKPQRNYMVVGDDDQTIYEWRGANPHFILNFGTDYQATRYVMSENFRCTAGPLTLANAVIRHNHQRYEKHLLLTQGLGGTTTITRSQDRKAMGAAIVATVRDLLATGDRLQEMAVLVRAKAQTPPVELALIQAQIPYQVVGGEPFYARWEVMTLIAYCRMALFEQQLQKGKHLSAAEASQLVESWEQLYRHPKRYISQVEARQIGDALQRGRVPVTEVLRKTVIADKPHLQPRLAELATLLEWLSSAFATVPNDKSGGKPAHAILQELERKLGYCAYLEQRGTLSEAGVDEAENVKQFIEEAKGHGTLKAYLVYLKELAQQQATQQAKAGRKLITIRTIHSAKGLEWPVVILPSCDDGNIPHRKSDNIEEERRLLYVALTRSRRDLYIYHLAPQPSSFLTQAKWQTILRAVANIRAALGKPSATWSIEEVKAVAAAMTVPELGLAEYLQHRHPWKTGEWHGVVQRLEAMQREGRKGAQPSVAQLSPEKRQERTPVIKAQGESAPTAPPRPAAYSWQAFDVVHHPRYGQGIVISTTTTTRGRELKVQFANGTLMHFWDDDGLLRRE